MKLHTLSGLKQARKEAGFTQEQLANRINTNIHTVQNWEQGRTLPEYTTLFQLTEILGCNIDYLFGNIECRTHDLQFIHDQIGLSEEAIIKLNQSLLPKDKLPLDILLDRLPQNAPAIISKIICTPQFKELMHRIDELLKLTESKALGIVWDDLVQHLTESKTMISLGLQNEQSVFDIKEVQIYTCFSNIIKQLEKEEADLYGKY